jgi:antitoxin (DNA-binding transcriptional repressor) of toxin-antitoxin stability system
VNRRPTILLAILPARLPEYRALPAIFEAWLNLSQREKARVFVTVRTRAIAIIKGMRRQQRYNLTSNKQIRKVTPPPTADRLNPKDKRRGEKSQLTDKRQPLEPDIDDGDEGEGEPQRGLRVQRQPEEAGVGRVDDLGAGLAALEDPLAVARREVDLVPPPQPYEPAPCDVLEVVEVGGEQQDRDDEDEHQVLGEEHAEEIDKKRG